MRNTLLPKNSVELGHMDLLSTTSFPHQIQVDNIALADPAQVKAAKLLETLSTQITIFDNRVYDIIPMTYERDGIIYPGKFDYLEKHLNIKVFPERGGLFGHLRRPRFLANTHFLIMHISFLEENLGKILETSGQRRGG